MSNLSIYFLILCVYIILLIINLRLDSFSRKIDLILNYNRLMKFRDDKEFFEFLINDLVENNGGNK